MIYTVGKDCVTMRWGNCVTIAGMESLQVKRDTLWEVPLKQVVVQLLTEPLPTPLPPFD